MSRRVWDESKVHRKPHLRNPVPSAPQSTPKMLRPDRKFWWLCQAGVLYFLSLHLPDGMSHPQCLDFKPPFRPTRELELCVMYTDFGCCDYQKDQELLAKYYQIVDNLDYDGYSRCAGFVLELLCQVGTGSKVKT